MPLKVEGLSGAGSVVVTGAGIAGSALMAARGVPSSDGRVRGVVRVVAWCWAAPLRAEGRRQLTVVLQRVGCGNRTTEQAIAMESERRDGRCGRMVQQFDGRRWSRTRE